LEHFQVLLDGLESTSELLTWIPYEESLFRSRANALAISSKGIFPVENFEASLVTLYAKILEFQSRALCYLLHHNPTRQYRDAFKRDEWDTLPKEIKECKERTKPFIDLIQASSVEECRSRIEELNSKVEEVISEVEGLGERQDAIRASQEKSARDENAKKCLRMLHKSNYRGRKDRNRKHTPGTCQWFTGHQNFNDWNENRGPGLLWVSADPGSGKSVLARYLIDEVLPSTIKRTTSYFFFKDDFPDQRSSSNAMCAILCQIFLQKPHLLKQSVLDKTELEELDFADFSELWVYSAV
jgi:hypothetical protein